ncbi:MAG: alpha/beta hydrolase [Chloroflexaceae bacterium]|nr:alpha/beta hydrolase [Chloroflexaceae bacterium]
MGERLTGLIVESGFADTFGLLARLGIRAQRATEQQDGFQNAEKMTRIVTPTCIIHGQNDVLIPPSDGEELYRCAAASDKTLVLIPRGGHNDLMMIGMTEYFTAIKQFVHRV